MVELVAIVNLTPDSFSDGGKFADAAAALDALSRYIEDGATVIDIGAESTRPGATPVSAPEEWKRLEPVLSGLHRIKGAAISVDTRHAETARRALDCGTDWINDVGGFSSPEMVAAVKNNHCRLVVMHSLSVPADTSITLPAGIDVAEALLGWARARIAALEAQGIARGRIVFDPGLGFGKTAEQSHAIVRDIKKFKALEVPILVGHSRKSFLGKNIDRDAATLSMSLALAAQGVDYLRVHDVAAHARALYKERKYG